MSNYRRVMVHDVMGTIDLNGHTPRFIMANDRLHASGQADAPPLADGQTLDQTHLVGRDAFLQRQENKLRREDATAKDGKSDSTELDEEGVVRPDQATAGIATLANGKARGREAFMQRQANVWKQPSGADEQACPPEDGVSGNGK